MSKLTTGGFVNLYIYILLGILFFYANYRLWLKEWLVCVPEKSLRFRFAALAWEPNRLKQTKACLLYWYYLPTTFLLYTAGTILSLIATVPLIVVPWFFGFIPSGINNRGPRMYDASEMYYRYKYSPRTGRFKRYAPWHYAVIFMSVLGIIFLTSAIRWLIISLKEGAGQTAISSVGHTMVNSIFLITLGIILASVTLLSVLYANRYRLLRLWNEKMCPNLIVLEENDK